MFVLAYYNTEGCNQVSLDSFKKYYLPRVKIENYDIEIDRREFYNQLINDSVKQYDEVRKVSTGQGDDYATGCLLDFAYFEKKLQTNRSSLSKQKALHANSRAIQQIVFTGKIIAAVPNTRVIIYYILWQSKETFLQFLKQIEKCLTTYKWLNTVKKMQN